MMTLAEAAELLGVTPATLRQQIANGRFAAEKVGPIYVTTAAEVERYRRDSLGKVGRPRRRRHHRWQDIRVEEGARDRAKRPREQG